MTAAEINPFVFVYLALSLFIFAVSVLYLSGLATVLDFVVQGQPLKADSLMPYEVVLLRGCSLLAALLGVGSLLLIHRIMVKGDL